MHQTLPPIPFPASASMRWLLSRTPILAQIRARSEAEQARNGGEGVPADDQQAMEFES